MKYQYPVYVQVVCVHLSNGAAVKRKKKWHEPILPGLKPRFVEDIMERLPVIEDLVAVMDDVGGGAHVAEASEHQQWQKPA